MNTSLILVLFAVCCVFLANFPQSAQAATKKVYFEYGSEAEVTAECPGLSFGLGKTTGEPCNGLLKQYLYIETSKWPSWIPNYTKVTFRVQSTGGSETKYDTATVGELRNTNELDFADQTIRAL